MMFRTTLTGLAASLACAAAPALAGAADTQAALSACAGGFPDAAGIAKGLAAAGFADRGDMGGMRMFVSADGKTVAGTRGSAQTGLRCIVMEDRLSPRQAGALAEALLKQMPGASALTPPTKEVTELWSGMLNNQMSHVFIAKSFAFDKIAGAALLVEAQ